MVVQRACQVPAPVECQPQVVCPVVYQRLVVCQRRVVCQRQDESQVVHRRRVLFPRRVESQVVRLRLDGYRAVFLGWGMTADSESPASLDR